MLITPKKYIFFSETLFKPVITLNLLPILWKSQPWTFALIITGGLCHTPQAIAQTPNPNSLPSDRLEEIPLKTLPSEVLTQPSNQEELLPPAEQQASLGDNDPNLKFQVNQIEVVGSTIFQAADFQPITSNFVGREVTFAELMQVKDAITKLYTDKGYVTTGALITPQTLEAGVVKIQVVEGSLEDIKISGTKRLRDEYIRSRLRLAAKTPLNVPRLLDNLQMLKLDPQIKNISAELQTGVRPGTNSLQLQVKEADTFRVTTTLDNGRSPSVGSLRRGAELNQANLLGFGDSLSIGYSNTNGSNTLNANYTLPINSRNGTISFSYGQGRNTVIEKPFSVLDIQSKSRNYELGIRQPFIQKPTQEFAMGLSFSRQFSQTELGIDNIGGFPLSPGADSQGRTKISAFRFTQEYTQRTSQQVFAARSQFSLGVDWFGANVNDNAPDSRFFAWRGQAQWLRKLASDTLFIVKNDVQIAADSLVPLEQLGLGGSSTVRGYRQDALLTDSGILLSAEFRLPVARIPKLGGVLQVTPFLDIGKGWNHNGQNPANNTLIGTGFGLLWQQNNSFSARLDWGIPLTSVEGERSSLQENGLYFSLSYSPF
ncbi:ShlB/FhaC/HecB family hemolysin secretion/activation protein [Calothrix sp. 336/3]|uniref:ShlB/FhaC/HecB family hemolysin secretion/activation protein n=1 Tax=Calothrix sp. 336/3 TaxID=1337936 RepID=UPI00069ABEF2|nr:ShlB/FhaC/HecB family hemolysin secretion/activation protein [Calothrix sp. 336/3]